MAKTIDEATDKGSQASEGAAGQPVAADEVRDGPTAGRLRWADMEKDAVITVRCIGCGGLVPQMEGPTHRYVESSPGCWHLFGEVLAREYSDRAFAAWHRLTVDSYAVQHPGRPSPQSIQSVCVHLISLCLVVERALEPAYATRVMGTLIRPKGRFTWLTPPPTFGDITVVDVAAVSTAAAHVKGVRDWAASAWAAWAHHHATVRSWLPKELSELPNNEYLDSSVKRKR